LEEERKRQSRREGKNLALQHRKTWWVIMLMDEINNHNISDALDRSYREHIVPNQKDNWPEHIVPK
jgi:hypothetical protein